MSKKSKLPLIPFEDEYLNLVIKPKVYDVVDSLDEPSPTHIYEAFKDEYPCAISFPRFRKWLKQLGIEPTKGWHLQRPPTRTLTQAERLLFERQAQEKFREMTERLMEQQDPMFKAVAQNTEEVVFDAPPPARDIPTLGFEPPEPNILPGGVPAPRTL